MATIQIVIDDPLLERLDHELRGRAKQRSAFVRSAIERELRRVEKQRLQELDRQAYAAPETEQERTERAGEAKLSARAWADLPPSDGASH